MIRRDRLVTPLFGHRFWVEATKPVGLPVPSSFGTGASRQGIESKDKGLKD
jgi:hypothetical protein